MLGLCALLILAAFWSGPGRSSTSHSLRRARQSFNQRQYRRSLEHFRHYFEKRGHVSRQRSEDALIYMQMAEAAEKAGRYGESFQALSRALGLYKKLGDGRGMARALRKMGAARAFQGDYAESLRLLALSSQVPSGRPGPEERAEALRGLSVAYGALGRYELQRKAAEAALTLDKRRPSPAGEAASLNLLATHYQSQGEFSRALDHCTRALAAARRSERPDLTPIYLTLSGVHRARGDYREALKAGQRALSAATASGVQEAVAVAEANLALDAMTFGEYERARTALERAHDLFEEAGARDDRARMLLELGRVAYYQERHEEALNRLDASLELFRASGQRAAQAVVESARGRVLLAMERPRESLAAHDRALRMFEELSDPLGQSSERVNRGFALEKLRRLDEALRSLRRGEAGPGEAELRWRAAYGRARVLRSRGDREGARRAFLQAVDGIEDILERSRIPEFRSSFLGGADRMRVYDELVDLLEEMGRTAEALETAERARARAFLDLMSQGRIDLRAGVDAALLEEERRLRQRIGDLSRKLSRGRSAPGGGGVRSEGPLREIDVQLRALREEYHDLLGRIAAESPALSSLVAVERSSVRQIQRTLLEGDLLLVYQLGEGRSRVFALTADRVVSADIGLSRKRLRSLVEVFRLDLQDSRASDRQARKLYKALVAPVEKHLSSTRRLVIAPHDALHYLPFQALVGPGGRYLLERFPISYTPSAATLRALGARTRPLGTRLVAAGDPATEGNLPPLPKAREEVLKISSFFPRSKVFTGREATEARMRRYMPEGDVLHFACHGLLDPTLPLYSGLALSPGGGLDGRLELHEVFGLDLRSSLVVLSACQTAVGSLSRGDDLVCLARSFLHAGSSSVVASLWNVPDDSTALLMEHFYAALDAGLGKAEALREAALHLRRSKEYSDPNAWAAFCLMGSYK